LLSKGAGADRRHPAHLSRQRPSAAGAIVDISDRLGSQEDDMRNRGFRGIALAVLLVGLAAPAHALESRVPLTWGQQMVAAVRLWFGELIMAVSEEEDDTTLKQHVDNPGQTP
jgi:hypothetical protein